MKSKTERGSGQDKTRQEGRGGGNPHPLCRARGFQWRAASRSKKTNQTNNNQCEEKTWGSNTNKRKLDPPEREGGEGVEGVATRTFVLGEGIRAERCFKEKNKKTKANKKN
jgi:hypothetical protein